MPATKKPPAVKATNVFVLRIDLAHLKPAIWRRIEVPSDIGLSKLHNVIQMAFDWTDSHLHGFNIGNAIYGPGDPDPFGFGMKELDERKHKLSSVAKAGDRFTYTYDFGDDWIHAIKVEKVTQVEPGVHYPRCTAGKNAAPPDDCGGPWGYAELLRALADPSHPDREELLEWLDEDFDPKAFDIDDLNAGFRMLKV
ncbi:MAG: plasmid pRiA4b ORF-3 family protein [Rhodocyclales bacterium]|nr:plasmid pRiA4b ORF-3 family protein [Rhodocyclales bacterium]